MANARTLRKRIALVAAAAVGVGVLAAAPAFAAVDAQLAADFTSLSLATVTATPTANAAVVVNVGAVTVAQTPGVGNNVIANLTGYLSSYPSGAFVQTAAVATATGTTTVLTNTLNSVSGSTLIATGQGTATATFGNTVAASATLGVGSFSFTPNTAGVYTLSVWNDANKDGIVNIGEAVQTVNVTVAAAAAAAAYSNSLSTAYIVAGNGTAAADSTSDAAGANASKSLASGTNAAAITVSLKDTTGTAMASGNTLVATVSGPGLILATTDNAPTASKTGVNTRYQSLSTADAVNTIYVDADGTSGTGTITISVTNAAGVTTVLATKTINFYGAVASVTATQKVFVAKAGGNTSGTNSGTADNTTFALTPAVVVTLKDANGNIVPGAASSVSGLSSDTSILSTVSTVTEDSTTAKTNGGAGNYNSAVATGPSSTSGQSATITFRYTPDSGTTYINAAPLTFTLGGAAASATVTASAASYAPGGKVTLTVTAKDSSGNPAADGDTTLYTAALTSTAAMQGTLPAAAVTLSKGSATVTGFYAPVTAGSFSLNGTFVTALGGAALTVPIVVAAAPVDTTAVDAATAAAKAASAAVAALSVTVAALIASVTAQLRALTIIVKKIQAKLKIK